MIRPLPGGGRRNRRPRGANGWISSRATAPRIFPRRVRAFMEEHIYPQELEIEAALDREVNTTTAFPEILIDIRAKAKAEGLWNLFLPDEEDGPGLSNVDYGIVNEEIGRATIPAAYAFNCQPPDSGNMEILVEHANPQQRERWLMPLLEGDIRSCFSMTEPETSGNDPTGLEMPRRARRRRLGDQRPQVVDDERARRLGGDRDGGHRPRRRAAQAGDDAAGPDRRARLQHGPPALQHGPRRRPRPLGNRLRRLPRAGRRGDPERGRQRLQSRPGPARPGPHPPLHAADRRRRAGARDDVRARPEPRNVRHPARPTASSSRTSSPSRGRRSTRPSCSP